GHKKWTIRGAPLLLASPLEIALAAGCAWHRPRDTTVIRGEPLEVAHQPFQDMMRRPEIELLCRSTRDMNLGARNRQAGQLLQQIRIDAKLQHMLGLRGPRQLGILRLVGGAAVRHRLSDQEIRESEPAPVREGTLVDERGPIL